MIPRPKYQDPDYQGSDKLLNKVAIYISLEVMDWR